MRYELISALGKDMEIPFFKSSILSSNYSLYCTIKTNGSCEISLNLLPISCFLRFTFRYFKPFVIFFTFELKINKNGQFIKTYHHSLDHLFISLKFRELYNFNQYSSIFTRNLNNHEFQLRPNLPAPTATIPVQPKPPSQSTDLPNPTRLQQAKSSRSRQKILWKSLPNPKSTPFALSNSNPSKLAKKCQLTAPQNHW